MLAVMMALWQSNHVQSAHTTGYVLFAPFTKGCG